MKILISKFELDNLKSNEKVPLRCKNCNKTFYIVKNQVLASIKFINGDTKKSSHRSPYDFCSMTCYGQSNIQEFKTKCYQCNKDIIKKHMAFKKSKSKRFFCSRSCAATYNNLHKTKGNRCSKLEKWLQEKLPQKYKNLKFIFNKKDAINSELDIFIPSLNIAFELNGIYHYEPIHGIGKLQQIQSNDNNKFQACLKNNIELCIIDSSSLSYFKEQNAQKYLDIICLIIDKKINLVQAEGIEPSIGLTS